MVPRFWFEHCREDGATGVDAFEEVGHVERDVAELVAAGGRPEGLRVGDFLGAVFEVARVGRELLFRDAECLLGRRHVAGDGAASTVELLDELAAIVGAHDCANEPEVVPRRSLEREGAGDRVRGEARGVEDLALEPALEVVELRTPSTG